MTGNSKVFKSYIEVVLILFLKLELVHVYSFTSFKHAYLFIYNIINYSFFIYFSVCVFYIQAHLI